MHYKVNKDQNGDKGDKGDAGTLTEEQIEKIKLAILQADNPVGTIRVSLTNTNPADYLGFGTWMQISKGRFLVGVDENDNSFATPEKTGGSKYMQAHNHTFLGNTVDGKDTDPVGVRMGAHLGGNEQVTSSAGEGSAENLPPYFACYIWRRRA